MNKLAKGHGIFDNIEALTGAHEGMDGRFTNPGGVKVGKITGT